MKTYLIKNATMINEGRRMEGDLLVEGNFIARIDKEIDAKADVEIDAGGQLLLPGVIDDQVHFREPGLTHKAEIYTEARAAVAGGTTSFMEMPNTKPPALTIDLLEDKYLIGKHRSMANYSFFMGVSNDNTDEVLKADPEKVCGIKIFMGSSTGNMLVDDEKILERLFSEAPMLIATHCEDEETIRQNTERYKQQFGEDIPFQFHPLIRDVDACHKSSSFARELATKHNTRLHILHITTAKEANLFRNDIPLGEKRITSEVCVHHLWYTSDDYVKYGSRIKCNPAIKEKSNRSGLWKALLDDRLDIIATDHAPHTAEEKDGTYFNAPAGVPLIQFSLPMMLQASKQGQIPLEKVVEKMCHAPAECFQIDRRGYLREGYFADLVLVKEQKYKVQQEDLLYKCGWSPMVGHQFDHKVTHTFVSGHLAYQNGQFDESQKGMRLAFNR